MERLIQLQWKKITSRKEVNSWIKIGNNELKIAKLASAEIFLKTNEDEAHIKSIEGLAWIAADKRERNQI